jgi:LmbE family N-acetylglucosaminyl deacetylase
MRVLVVAAHPDDELLGAGATLARHADRGDEVTAIIASEGATARYEAGAASMLERCAREAAEVLGLRELRFLGFPDQRMDTRPLVEITQAIEKVLAEVRPHIVYTHFWGDLNRDHRIVSEATQVACRPIGVDYPQSLLAFETPSSTEWAAPDPSRAFLANHFVDVSATIDRKLAAMARYTSEVRPPPHPRSLEALRARAASWGHIVGRGYAEAFVVIRQVE